MNEKKSPLRLAALSACLLLALAANSQAEIYKWVDANGKTHYSENKDDAGKAKAEELKISSKPAQTAAPSTNSWHDKEQEFKQRQVQRQQEQSHQPSAARPSRPAPSANQPETDASRCEFARDVNSGALRHPNGAKTDANDRMIAERDVRTYCH